MAWSTLTTQNTGDPTKASWANQVKSNDDAHEDRLNLLDTNSPFVPPEGDGSDGVGPTTGSLVVASAGKQYTSWSIPGGNTVTLPATATASSPNGNDGNYIFAIQGTLTIDGTLEATGAGLAGGQGSLAAGSQGFSSLRTGLQGGAGGGGGGNSGGGGSVGGQGGDAIGVTGGAGGSTAPTAGGNGTDAKTGSPRGYGDLSTLNASPGGGGGAGDGGSSGGDGGPGGPCIAIWCDELAGSGTLNALGANGTNAAGDGGGGAGCGGTVVIFCRTDSSSLSIDVTGGTGGTGGGTGANGGDGGDGRFKIVVLG